MTRETELSRLVALAHKMRARERALYAAGTLNQPVFVYRTKNGWLFGTDAPMVDQTWHVATPAGEYLTMKRKA